MRSIPRHRHHHKSKSLLISISQAEITADLIYPAHPRAARQRAAAGSRRAGR